MSRILREEIERGDERVEILIEVDETPYRSSPDGIRGVTLGSEADVVRGTSSRSADPASRAFTRGMRGSVPSPKKWPSRCSRSAVGSVLKRWK